MLVPRVGDTSVAEWHAAESATGPPPPDRGLCEGTECEGQGKKEMEIKGFSENQLAALCEIWKLGKPIDVSVFLDREDIPNDAKVRIKNAGSVPYGSDSTAPERAYRTMQAQIILEVAKLDKRQWSSAKAKKKNG